jgi:hypothetical protein
MMFASNMSGCFLYNACTSFSKHNCDVWINIYKVCLTYTSIRFINCECSEKTKHLIMCYLLNDIFPSYAPL